jgi:hypothetical protein
VNAENPIFGADEQQAPQQHQNRHMNVLQDGLNEETQEHKNSEKFSITSQMNQAEPMDSELVVQINAAPPILSQLTSASQNSTLGRSKHP